MKQAVSLAAKADAYNRNCDKDSTLAEQFLKQFSKNEFVTEEQNKALFTLGADTFEALFISLQEKPGSCKDLDVMMTRLQVMKELRKVSYVLNGVDEKDVPASNMPELEKLMPQEL